MYQDLFTDDSICYYNIVKPKPKFKIYKYHFYKFTISI